MIGKFLVRTAITTGAVAGAVHLVRKYNLTEKAAKGAEAFIAKGIGLTDELLSRFDEKTSNEPKPSQAQTDTEDPLSGREHLKRLLDLAQQAGEKKAAEASAKLDGAWATATRRTDRTDS